MEQGTLVSKTKTYVAYPDKFRVDATSPGAQVVQVYNAGSAWVRDPAGVHDAPPEMRDEFGASVRRDTIPVLIAAAEGRLALRLLPDEGAEGRVFEGARDQRAAAAGRAAVHRQPELHRPPVVLDAGSRRQARCRQKKCFRTTAAWTASRCPSVPTCAAAASVILARTLTSVSLNTPVDDALFARPQ